MIYGKGLANNKQIRTLERFRYPYVPLCVNALRGYFTCDVTYFCVSEVDVQGFTAGICVKDGEFM